MQIYTHQHYDNKQATIAHIIDHFDQLGQVIYDGRNTVKKFDIDGKWYNCKRFKKPNIINKMVYRFIRKPKAQRSFEYAQRLLEKKIGTPRPVAYAIDIDGLGLGYSYYISDQLEADFTFRELINDDSIKDKERILRSYTAFMYKMHEAGVYFMDNSPGNTLIFRDQQGDYQFALVDLNRMKFYDIPWQDRLRNFERLSPQRWMYEVMGDEYSLLSQKPNSNQTIEQMWVYTQEFQRKFQRKKRFKKRLKSLFKL